MGTFHWGAKLELLVHFPAMAYRRSLGMREMILLQFFILTQTVQALIFGLGEG